MLLLGLFFATNALAASGTARIVLVASDNAELARKVRAEAEHVGISTATESRAVSAGDAELVRRHGAVGVVELASPDRVRIHLAPSGEHGAYDAVVERAPADGDGFAVRVVEQVRGRLVELRLLPAEPEAAPQTQAREASAPPALGANPSRPRQDRPDPAQGASGKSPTLGLAVGGAGTVAFGGVGATPAASLALRLEPTSRWAATLRALLPATSFGPRARRPCR
jgi:hypothetical protein